VKAGTVAVIGGPVVFEMFFDRFDVFWLSQAPHLHLPDGEPCFPGVPAQSPQEILAGHGLTAREAQILDAAHDVSVTAWRRG
ncbi:MAG: dihydrofolate reductase, partial [Tardiphaga sp.]|nr:dihydrofolate reductase [Tardiphaga sp.]